MASSNAFVGNRDTYRTPFLTPRLVIDPEPEPSAASYSASLKAFQA